VAIVGLVVVIVLVSGVTVVDGSAASTAIANIVRVNVKPPGFDDLLTGAGSLATKQTSCSTTAAFTYAWLTTKVKQKMADELVAFGEAVLTSSVLTAGSICTGAARIIPMALSVRHKDATPVYDHWFIVQTYGASGVNAMLHQGFCEASIPSEAKAALSAREAYTGEHFMTPAAISFGSQLTAPTNVPPSADHMPTTCAVLEAAFIALQGATTKADVNDLYNFLFAPTANQCSVRGCGWMWKKTDDRAKFAFVKAAAAPHQNLALVETEVSAAPLEAPRRVRTERMAQLLERRRRAGVAV